MCNKCDAIKTLSDNCDKKNVEIYDMKYNGLGHITAVLHGVMIGERRVVSLKTIVHANGKAYETSMNIHNCPFCGERLV